MDDWASSLGYLASTLLSPELPKSSVRYWLPSTSDGPGAMHPTKGLTFCVRNFKYLSKTRFSCDAILKLFTRHAHTTTPARRVISFSHAHTRAHCRWQARHAQCCLFLLLILVTTTQDGHANLLQGKTAQKNINEVKVCAANPFTGDALAHLAPGGGASECKIH